MRTRTVPVALLSALALPALLLGACASGSGSSGNAAGAHTIDIDIDMRDTAYRAHRRLNRRLL